MTSRGGSMAAHSHAIPPLQRKCLENTGMPTTQSLFVNDHLPAFRCVFCFSSCDGTTDSDDPQQILPEESPCLFLPEIAHVGFAFPCVITCTNNRESLHESLARWPFESAVPDIRTHEETRLNTRLMNPLVFAYQRCGIRTSKPAFLCDQTLRFVPYRPPIVCADSH